MSNRGLLLLVCALALLTLRAQASAEEQVPQIARVNTLEELRALKAARAGDWEVRVGMSEGGSESGPWELVYCHAIYTGAAAKPPRLRPVSGGQDEVLGPLVVRAMDERYEMALHRALTEAGAPPKEALFCQIVLLPTKAKYRVEVLGPEGEPLFRSRIDLREPRPRYWQAFAEVRWRDGQRRDTLAQDPRAARPRYDGVFPVLPDPVPRQVEEKRERSKPRNQLPGAVPLDPRWSSLGAIELAARDGQFVVRSKATKMVLRPDRHLLARWWVNNKAVVPRRELTQLYLQQQEQLKLGDEISLPLGLPRHLGELKPGDRVALQVMYAPAGHQPLPPEGATVQESLQMEAQRPVHATPPVPLLSNRIELDVTKELLTARDGGG
jgi:hypothetical protein